MSWAAQTLPTSLPKQTPLPAGRIPTLDGLRAVSVGMVLIGHFSRAELDLPPLLRAIAGNSGLGVYIFFVVSGFLITRLLLDERRRTGAIAVRHFYLRRAFRIFPAFYVMLATLALLSAASVIHLTGAEIAAAGLYVWNYVPGSSWYLGHTWTLAIEEQFYALWPNVLQRWGPGAGLRIAAAVIALSPLVRVGMYFALPRMRSLIPIMLHTRADALMYGAALAFLYDHARFRGWLQSALRGRHAALIAVFVLGLDPALVGRWQGAYLLPFGYSLEGLSIALLMAWLLQNPRTAAAHVLNWRPLVYIGKRSYSLYLWQQLFLGWHSSAFRMPLPLSLFCLWIAAEISYRLVERPCLRWREAHIPALPGQVETAPAPLAGLGRP